MARSLEGLEETKRLVRLSAASSGSIRVHIIQADLANLTGLQDIFEQACSSGKTHNYEQVLLIHNAASVGDLTKPMSQQTDTQVLQDYLAGNVTSVYVLTALFLSKFASTVEHKYIVNVTSLLASNFNYGFGFYSSGKAARNALMGVVAAENPNVRCLNYSPGVVDTDMIRRVGRQSFAESVREGVKKLYGKGVMATAEQAAVKLVEILTVDKFLSGTLLDFNDKL